MNIRFTHESRDSTIKKYPDNAKFAAFLSQLNDFKHQLQGQQPG